MNICKCWHDKKQHVDTCHGYASTSVCPDKPYFGGSMICYCMKYEEISFEELIDKMRSEDDKGKV
jgi:hypothetical protein